MATKKTITVQGNEISLFSQGSEDYISLTDMAKGFEGEAGEYIRNWLRTGPTVLFLGTWEKVNNPDFNLVSYHQIRSEVIDNRFIMSVKKWVEMTNAIGLEARAGRYGGTYAIMKLPCNSRLGSAMLFSQNCTARLRAATPKGRFSHNLSM